MADFDHDSDEEDPFFSYRDPMLEPDGNTADRNPFRSRVAHTRACTSKNDTIRDTLARIVDDNRAALATGESFARRPNNRLCYCRVARYNIVLTKSTIECVGCKRNIRSASHMCHVYDLFSEKEPLGRHQKPIYDAIRRSNFLLLAERLPYTLPKDVLDNCIVRVPACQSVEFLDRV